MIPTPNQVTHKIKYHALIISKYTPRIIAINGSINKSNATSTCLTVFETFNSIFYHILIDDLLPLLKMTYIISSTLPKDVPSRR